MESSSFQLSKYNYLIVIFHTFALKYERIMI